VLTPLRRRVRTMASMSALLLAIARATGLLVTGYLATVGSFGLGFGVLTECTTDNSSCSTTNAVLTGGWVLQGVLLVVALGVCLPPLSRRVRRPVLVVLALAVPVVSIAAFAGVSWVADHSYCHAYSDDGDRRDQCDGSALTSELGYGVQRVNQSPHPTAKR
jgi:hypothetical protein